MRKRLLRLASSAHMRMTPSVETSIMSLATVEQNLLFKSSTELKWDKDERGIRRLASSAVVVGGALFIHIIEQTHRAPMMP